MGPMEKFNAVFKTNKPILGMVHLKGEGREETLARAKKEIDLLLQNGATAVVIENYFGSEDDVEAVLAYIQQERPDIIYGVNMLDNDARGFAAAAKYGAKFLQLDSVAGHLTPEDDVAFGEQMAAWRKTTDALVLGGVRFKYQPYLSGRTLEEDLRIGMGRCDAIVVTGEGTGLPTSQDKITQFRAILGPGFPLVIGAGVTPESCAAQFKLADAAIVGSYFKDTYKDTGDVHPGHVRAFMQAVEACR